MIAPLERRLQLITGKGGTGKTTLAAALALAHAARGRRPLVIELGHRSSLARVLDVPSIDATPREVLPGVFATNLEVHHATQALAARALPSRIAARMLRAAPVRAFLDAAPGVVEIATLDRIRAFVDESDFDPILVDGDATGHTKMLFALHGVLASIGVSGTIGAILDRTSGLFSDASSAAVHLSALPTSLAVEETLELAAELRARADIALGCVLLDRVEGSDDVDPAALDRAITEAPPGLASALALLRVDRERDARAETLRARLSSHRLDVRVAREATGPLDVPALRALGLALLGAAS